jgi:hypothetical protein
MARVMDFPHQNHQVQATYKKTGTLVILCTLVSVFMYSVLYVVSFMYMSFTAAL